MAGGLLTPTAVQALIALALAVWAAGYWYMMALTLVNPKACVLYRDAAVVEQPVELEGLTQRHTADAVGSVSSSASIAWSCARTPASAALAQLLDMGFDDVARAQAALEEVDWNLDAAVTTLLGI